MTTEQMRNSPTITQANLDDVPEILAMIKELADYEKEPAKVEATEESLRRTLTFNPSCTKAEHTNPGYAKCLMLRCPLDPTDDYKQKIKKYAPKEQGGEVAGMALYFHNYSTWRSKPGVYLEDLFVRPQYRKRGWGKFLIRALAQEVLRIDGGRLEWSCLKWNEPSLAFYKTLGAKRMDDWVQLRVDGGELYELATGQTGEEAVGTAGNGHAA